MKNKVFGLIIVLIVAIPLLTYNLSQWPTIWYDEGLNLQIPKNLVLFGQYGIWSSKGFRLFVPIISTGPTVTIPIALIFKALGPGLLQARVVMVIYSLLAISCFFFLANHIFDGKTATVASLLLVVTPPTLIDISSSFLGLGRMGVGEVPALFYLVLGSLFWFQALDKNSKMLMAGSGIFFGLAIITKSQNYLVFVALIFVWGIDRLWNRHLQWFQVAIPIVMSFICVSLWEGYEAYTLSLSHHPEQSQTFDERIILQALIGLISPQIVVQSIGALFASGVLIWGIPGLVYGFYVSAEQNLEGVKRLFLLSICVIWLGWFAVGSIGWLRYAFPALAMMNIFLAKLLVDLSEGFSISWRSLLSPSKSTSQDITKTARILAVILALILMIFVPLRQRAESIISTHDTTAFEFAQYLDEQIPQNVIIETFEPEIAFLTNHKFNQPPLNVLNAAIRYVQFGQPYPPDVYNYDQYEPSYLVNGPFGKMTELYTNELQDDRYVLVTSIGNYDLYKIWR